MGLAHPLRSMLVALSVSALGVAPAAADDIMSLPSPIAKQLRTQRISPDDVSIYVHKVSDPVPLVTFNAEVPRNPASTIKLLTTKAGLDILGPTFTWKTVAYATGAITGGRLEGDLVIKGYGDPYLTPEALWRLLWGIRERGIETVAGNLILDNEFFEAPRAGRGDFDANANATYNALPSALSVNAQTTEVVLSGDRPGGPVRAFMEPPLANVAIDNRLRLVNAPCTGKFHKPVITLAQEGLQATLHLTGTFASECGESSYSRLMLDPAQHFAGAIVALWRDIGGNIKGAVRLGTLPAGARQIYAVSSPPLEEVIRRINKRSDNLMARTLFLTIGAQRLGAPGSLPNARQAVKDWLKESGLDFPELVLDNGAGLSRKAQISAQSMGRLLGYAYASPYMPELLSSLSIAGIDGTLRKRFRKTSLQGSAHMKTGTIRGTTGIAGFVLDSHDERWIVVSLMNNPRLQTWRGKAVENALLQWVHDGAGNRGNGSLTSRARGQHSGSGTSEPRLSATPGTWFLKGAGPAR